MKKIINREELFPFKNSQQMGLFILTKNMKSYKQCSKVSKKGIARYSKGPVRYISSKSYIKL